MKLDFRAERHHYSMFNVGCSLFSLFDVHLSKQLPSGPLLHALCTLRCLDFKALMIIIMSRETPFKGGR
jgi:hypothetical protein